MTGIWIKQVLLGSVEVEAAAVEQRRLLEQVEGFRLPKLVELLLPGQPFANYSYSLDRQNGTVHSFTSPFMRAR